MKGHENRNASRRCAHAAISDQAANFGSDIFDVVWHGRSLLPILNVVWRDVEPLSRVHRRLWALEITPFLIHKDRYLRGGYGLKPSNISECSVNG
jgi:hypothetical protein